MMLPGLSGGYLLVLSGQYVAILGAVDGFKEALLSGGVPDWQGLVAVSRVLAPFAVGALAALIGVSNLIGYLLRRQRSATLGVLLGLLAGAVLGLWPFEASRAGPAFPEPALGLAAMGFAVLGFAVTTLVGRLGDNGASA